MTDTPPQTRDGQDDLHAAHQSVQRLQQHLALSLAREQQAQDALDRQRARADDAEAEVEATEEELSRQIQINTKFEARAQRAEGEAERLRGLLRRLEWAGPAPMVPQVGCPACRRWRTGATRPGGVPDGHDPEGCWLAAELEPTR
jgi:hypothetical protein